MRATMQHPTAVTHVTYPNESAGYRQARNSLLAE
jgi:hypothetical protein